MFLGLDMPKMLFFLLINVKMETIVSILTFMSRKNFKLSWVEHEFFFIYQGLMMPTLWLIVGRMYNNKSPVKALLTVIYSGPDNRR